MRRRNDSIVDTIIYAKWWVGALLSLGSYILIRFMMPSFFTKSVLMGPGVEQAAPYLAGMVAFVFAGLSVLSLFREIIERWKAKGNGNNT